MTVTELNKSQLSALKQRYLTMHLMEVEDREPSMYELANADSTVDDSIIYEAYKGTEFTEDDFSVDDTDNTKAVYVNWDTDGEFVSDLPKIVSIPADIDDEDVADWLSDEYGWCVESWEEA